MAEDWIKIRSKLLRDPKVTAIADYLAQQKQVQTWLRDAAHASRDEGVTLHVARHVMRHVTIGALCMVWCAANEHGVADGDDLSIGNCTLEAIDDLCGIPCFGAAMGSVGWAIEGDSPAGGTRVSLPKFMLYNVPETTRRKVADAGRSRSYRERKKAKEASPSVMLRHEPSRDASRDHHVTPSYSNSESSGSLSFSEGESEGKPPMSGGGPLSLDRTLSPVERWNAASLVGIIEAYPARQRRRGPKVMQAIAEALDEIWVGGGDLPARAHEDPLGWLREQAARFAASAVGRSQFCPGIMKWVEERWFANEALWERAKDRAQKPTAADVHAERAEREYPED